MSIEAMKKALDAIDSAHADMRDEIAALRQAIEQAEKQEPVANRSNCGHKEFMPLCQMCQAMGTQAHSYTAPPRKEWVGLTGEELAQLTIDNAGYPTRLTAAIEAKLKEKNT